MSDRHPPKPRAALALAAVHLLTACADAKRGEPSPGPTTPSTAETAAPVSTASGSEPKLEGSWLLLALLAALFGDGANADADATPAPPRALEVAPMQGPFPGIAAFCGAARKTAKGRRFHCEADRHGEGGRASFAGKARAPYLDVQGVWVRDADDPDSWFATEYHLALRTGEGWFVTGALAFEHNPGASGITGALAPTRLDLEDVVPGGAPEVLLGLRDSVEDSDTGLNEAESRADERLVVCGIGASNRPSCTAAMHLGHEARRYVMNPGGDPPGTTHEGLFHRRWKIDAAFAGRELVLSSDDRLPETDSARLGRYALVFP